MGYQHPTDLDPSGDSVEDNGDGTSRSLALPVHASTLEIPKRCRVSVEGVAVGGSKFNLTQLAGTVTEADGLYITEGHPVTVKTLGRTHINHFTTTNNTIHVTPLND